MFKVKTKEEALFLLAVYVENLRMCNTHTCDIGDCSRCWRTDQNAEIEKYVERLTPADLCEPEHVTD